MCPQLTAKGGVPFTSADNPVLSQLSFLCNKVHPSVGAAAASAALKELKKTEPSQVESQADKEKENGPGSEADGNTHAHHSP